MKFGSFEKFQRGPAGQLYPQAGSRKGVGGTRGLSLRRVRGRWRPLRPAAAAGPCRPADLGLAKGLRRQGLAPHGFYFLAPWVPRSPSSTSAGVPLLGRSGVGTYPTAGPPSPPLPPPRKPPRGRGRPETRVPRALRVPTEPWGDRGSGRKPPAGGPPPPIEGCRPPAAPRPRGLRPRPCGPCKCAEAPCTLWAPLGRGFAGAGEDLGPVLTLGPRERMN